MAKDRVDLRAFSRNSSLLPLYSSFYDVSDSTRQLMRTMSRIKGSSGFGVLMRAWIVFNSAQILRTAVHAPFGGIDSVSRQILPSESMLG